MFILYSTIHKRKRKKQASSIHRGRNSNTVIRSGLSPVCPVYIFRGIKKWLYWVKMLIVTTTHPPYPSAWSLNCPKDSERGTRSYRTHLMIQYFQSEKSWRNIYRSVAQNIQNWSRNEDPFYKPASERLSWSGLIFLCSTFIEVSCCTWLQNDQIYALAFICQLRVVAQQYWNVCGEVTQGKLILN